MSQDKTPEEKILATKHPKYEPSQIQNIQIQNVPNTKHPKYKTSQVSTFPITKCPKYKLSQQQHNSSLKTSQLQNIPSYKPSKLHGLLDALDYETIFCICQ